MFPTDTLHQSPQRGATLVVIFHRKLFLSWVHTLSLIHLCPTWSIDKEKHYFKLSHNFLAFISLYEHWISLSCFRVSFSDASCCRNNLPVFFFFLSLRIRDFRLNQFSDSCRLLISSSLWFYQLPWFVIFISRSQTQSKKYKMTRIIQAFRIDRLIAFLMLAQESGDAHQYNYNILENFSTMNKNTFGSLRVLNCGVHKA